MPTSAELRTRARQSLQGQWGKNAGYLFLLYLVIGVVSFVVNLIPILGPIATTVISGAITLGIYGYYLDVTRGLQPSFSAFFSGFSQFWRAFVLYLLMAIFTLLWMLLLIVPGIIAAYRYTQSYYILKDNPEIGALEAIRRSKALMVGSKGRLFILQLTFIGWALLGILTLGIGYLWLSPYILTANAHFYEDLRFRSLQIPPPPAPAGLSV
jgi:uncharacterized membrane protein